MSKAFEKILEMLEEPQFDIGCGACPYKDKCDEVQETINDEMTDLCAETMRVIAKQIVQEVAEEYNNGWIPCSERLPEEMEDVLISVGSLKAVLGYYGHDKLWCFTDGMGSSKLIEQQELVIAWQPLPEPYKESD